MATRLGLVAAAILLSIYLPVSAVTHTPSAKVKAAVAPRAAAVIPNGSWTTYHHDNAHTGYDASAPAITTITPTAGWTLSTLDDEVYAEPLVYQGVVYAVTLNSTALVTVKTVAFTPMPRDSMAIAASTKPGLRRMPRRQYVRSWIRPFIEAMPRDYLFPAGAISQEYGTEPRDVAMGPLRSRSRLTARLAAWTTRALPRGSCRPAPVRRL